MKILITGGSGYIGSHACIALLELGHNLVVLDNLSNSSTESLKRVSGIVSVELAIVNMEDCHVASASRNDKLP